MLEVEIRPRIGQSAGCVVVQEHQSTISWTTSVKAGCPPALIRLKQIRLDRYNEPKKDNPVNGDTNQT